MKEILYIERINPETPNLIEVFSPEEIIITWKENDEIKHATLEEYLV